MNQQTSIKDEYPIYQKLKKEFDNVKNTDMMKEVTIYLNQVYIINNTWYKKWKKYAKSKASSRANFHGNHEKLFLKETKSEMHPGKINNSDLVYDQKEFINSTIDGTTDYVIRPDRKDFIKLVSKKIWDFLHSIYKGGPEIKRITYIQKDENNLMKTCLDLYYRHFLLYFAIKYDDEVDVKTIINKDPYKIFISNHKTIYEFKDIIMSCFLNIYDINLRLVKIYKRLWKVGILFQDKLKDFKKYIADKKDCIEKSISIDFPGNLFDQVPNISIGDTEALETEILIFEVVIQQNLKEINPIFKIEGSIEEDKCGNCKIKSLLFYCCLCKKAWYCSENCFFNDEKVHKQSCETINNEENMNLEEFKLEQSQISLLGVVGLKNLGNTCYMNTALQCLSNCYEVTLYFLHNKFIESINKDNPLGYKGLIAYSYARVVKELWYGIHKSFSPTQFKKIISTFHLNFSGYLQQDSQEFLLILLDALHEDLNKVKIKPYIAEISTKNKSDEKIAEESWMYYLMRNQSIFVDLFFGQFKSSLVCGNCNEVSTKFEPFMNISLPIPINDLIDFQINFVYYEFDKGVVRLNLFVEKEGKVINLRKKISKSLNINWNSFLLCHIINYRIDRIYNNLIPLDKISQILFAFQIDPKLYTNDYLSNSRKQRSTNKSSLNLELSRTLDESLIKYENSDLNNEELLFKKNCEGTPIYYSRYDNFLNEHRAEGTNYSSYKLNQPSLNVYTDDNYGLSNDFIKVFITFKSYDGFKNYVFNFLSYQRILYLKRSWNLSYIHIYIFNYLKELIYIISSDHLAVKGMDEKNAYNFIFDPNNKKLHSPTQHSHIDNNIPYIVKIINIKGKFDSKVCIICGCKNCYSCLLPFSETAKLSEIIEKYRIKGSTVNLDNNYLYLDPLQRKYAIPKQDIEFEIVFLPKYKTILYRYFSLVKSSKSNVKEQNEYQKNPPTSNSIYDCFSKFIQIESLDENNEWHCPNCKSPQKAKKKIEVWKTPPILIIQLKRFKNNRKVMSFIDFPINNFDLHKIVLNKDHGCTKYDLFAVCNHYGSLAYGHYTAFAKNYLSEKWYCFDDSQVMEIDEREIVSSNAYVLFYRRKDLLNKSFDLDSIFNKSFINFENLLRDNYLNSTEESNKAR